MKKHGKRTITPNLRTIFRSCAGLSRSHLIFQPIGRMIIWGGSVLMWRMRFFQEAIWVSRNAVSLPKQLMGASQMVCMTRGGQGAILSAGDRIYHQPIVETDIIDTLGAGDSFIAGFLTAFCVKQDITYALQPGRRNGCENMRCVRSFRLWLSLSLGGRGKQWKNENTISSVSFLCLLCVGAVDGKSDTVCVHQKQWAIDWLVVWCKSRFINFKQRIPDITIQVFAFLLLGIYNV